MARKQQYNQQSNQQVATILPPRLPAPPNLLEKFKIDPEQWGVLVDATFPSAKTTQGVLMALAYCQQRNLDIFRKPIHIVPLDVTDSDGNKRQIETIWPGIGETRITAQRQADFAGWDECAFGPDIEFRGEAKVQKWKDGQKTGWEQVKWLGPVPEWAQFTVYKMLHGQRIALAGPRVYFMETYSPVGRFNPSPNDRWARAPRQMLEKCAEAAALRRAWPDVFGDEASFEEMEGRHMTGNLSEGVINAAVEKTQTAAGPRPQRSDFRQDKAKEDIQDAVFEDVRESQSSPADTGQTGQNTASGNQSNGANEDQQKHQESKKEAPQEKQEAQGTDQAPRPLPLPSTQGQWEVWCDNMSDKVEAAHSLQDLESLMQKQAERIAAAPEDLRNTINGLAAHTALRWSTNANSDEGSANGSNQQPTE